MKYLRKVASESNFDRKIREAYTKLESAWPRTEEIQRKMYKLLKRYPGASTPYRRYAIMDKETGDLLSLCDEKPRLDENEELYYQYTDIYGNSIIDG